MARRISDDDMDAFLAPMAGRRVTQPRLKELLVQEFGYMVPATQRAYFDWLLQSGRIKFVGGGWFLVAAVVLDGAALEVAAKP